MKTTEQLLLATKDVWQQYNNHPFVMGIQDGTLDKEKFRYYMIQDYLYLEDYAKTFAVGVAKAKSLRIANLFAKYIPVMNGELNVHDGYWVGWGLHRKKLIPHLVLSIICPIHPICSVWHTKKEKQKSLRQSSPAHTATRSLPGIS